MNIMSINLWTGRKYWRVGVGVDKELGEEELKKVIVTIEQSLRRVFPNAEMPHRLAVRKLFGEED
ncbi:hypothetical protein ES703_28575 [subsurface metagenome]